MDDEEGMKFVQKNRKVEKRKIWKKLLCSDKIKTQRVTFGLPFGLPDSPQSTFSKRSTASYYFSVL